MQEMTIYNTATRKKEKLETIEEGVVRFYSCGQTVYELIHVGNAKTYIVWDVLVRTLKYFGYKVVHVQNFTDVGHLTSDEDTGEDKIQKRAKMLQMDPMELVDLKIKEYHQFMDTINVNRPNIAPRATGHIIEMIDMVKVLIGKEYAYELDGSIYFDISKFPDYGKMARLDLENLRAGARIEVIEGKRNAGDFALWIKSPEEHIMKYSSPWSIGYPGWHLECSVMAIKYLGETVDIHAGGIDHIPVHHTNEIAQSEATTGKKFANYWMHSAFITVNGEKMSKSKNNFVSLQELIDEVGRGAARFALGEAHYRTQADFSIKQAQSLKKRYYRIIKSYHLALQYLNSLDDGTINETEEDMSERIIEGFKKAMANDLNTPQAVTQINTAAKRIDQFRKEENITQLQYHLSALRDMMGVLGLPLIELNKNEMDRVNAMIALRIKVKEAGDFKASDTLRDYLQSLGYVLQDLSGTETQWYKEE